MSAKQFFSCLFCLVALSFSYSLEPDFSSIQMKVTLKELNPENEAPLSNQEYDFYFNKIDSKITPGMPDEILNWFDSDLGLLKNGYEPESCKRDDLYIITEYITKIPQPIFKVQKFSDSHNKVVKVIMFSTETDIFSVAKISKWTKLKTFLIPAQIKTEYYEDNKIKYIFSLDFTDIKTDPAKNEIKNSSRLVKSSAPSKINSSDIAGKKYSFTQPEQKFNTTIPQILVNGAYTFYKAYITEQDLSGCSYWPSCSAYMRTAVSKYGIPGIIIGLERLNRCTHIEKRRNLYPLSPGGFQLDYVK